MKQKNNTAADKHWSYDFLMTSAVCSVATVCLNRIFSLWTENQEQGTLPLKTWCGKGELASNPLRCQCLGNKQAALRGLLGITMWLPFETHLLAYSQCVVKRGQDYLKSGFYSAHFLKTFSYRTICIVCSLLIFSFQYFFFLLSCFLNNNWWLFEIIIILYCYWKLILSNFTTITQKWKKYIQAVGDQRKSWWTELVHTVKLVTGEKKKWHDISRSTKSTTVTCIIDFVCLVF